MKVRRSVYIANHFSSIAALLLILTLAVRLIDDATPVTAQTEVPVTTPAATPELFDSATAGGAQPVLPSEPPLVLPPNEIPADTAEALPLATDEPAGTDEPGTTAEPAATAEAPAATAEAPVIATTPPPTDEPADPATVVPTAEATAPPVTVTAAPPLADFTVEPGEVAAGRPITINNSSSGDITTWAWDFGDGTGTDAASPAPHTYAAAGVYTIRLTVSGPGGNASASRQVIVTGSGSVVEAIFSVAPGSAQDACFNSSSTGPIQSHTWDFGDGRRSSEPNPCHTYAAPGTYTVSLTVTGSDGISSSATRSITILAAEPPPAAAFTVSPSAGVTATTFQFQDTTSGLVSGWSWAFGDGATSSDRSPSHRYAQPGTYTATLTVTGPGGTSTASQSVTVQAPLIQLTCDFAAPGTPFEATPVALDGTAGNNIDGAALSYRWTVNGTEIATTEDTTYTFSAGYYTVTFTASPENGTPCSRSRSFNVLDAEGLYAEFDQSETRAPAGSEICFTDRTFGPVAGWSWSFGDGGSSSEPNPCHTYTTPGRYSITLTASAADGRQDSATAPVTIFATDQSLAILASATAGTAPLTVQFDAQQTGIDPATLLWGFPGGVQAAGSSVTYTFRAPGTYTVNLSGSGVQGAASASARIVVGEATGLRAAFTPSRWQGRAPAEICFTDQSAGDALQTWEWSLGDGQTASVASPCITYRRAGTYDVRLTVTNAHGQSASATNRITILAPVDDDSRSTPTPATTVPTTAAATPTTTDTATVTVTVTATPAAPVAVTVTTTPTAAVTITPEEDDSRSVKAPAPYITVFDPSLSKIGYLPAGSTGLPGEELVWEIIVSNVSALVETGIVVTDTIRNDLRIDRVEGSAGVNVSYSGQVVTASIATLPPGQSRRFWVYTTVLSSPLSGQFTNTAYPNRGLPAAATVNVPAAPPSGPLPVVSGVTDVSDFAGQQSCFNASLTNSGAPGYGPYLLVVLPPGVTFNSASFLTGGVVNVPTTRPSPDNGRWVDPVSGQTITVPVGGSLVVFRLPVGSVVTGNPPLVANICVTTDPLATPGVPLPVQVYGGYEFGSTPTGEGGSIVNPVPDNSTITPTLITFDKTNNAPEGERPPGPGWSYQYTLNVELAAGQTLNNVVVRDVMPNMPGQLAFQYTGPTTFGGTCLRGATTITPPAAGNGQTLTISLASLRETTLTQSCTLSITYTGYILDVLAENGTLNELDIINRASFDFDHATLPSPTLTDTNVVQAEHVTFQKLVNPAVAVPGDTLTYTINFQVTDYNSATQIVVVDIMPDGLSYVVGSGEIAIPGFTGGITPVIVPNGDGSLRLTFNVLAAAGQPAIAAGSAGTLTYQATIDQLYRSPVEPVRASDELTNAVTGGYTLTDGATDTNGSTADVLIQPITLTKETVTLPRNGIAAIHGETVRFRLTMTIPSGDTRAIVIEDFLPLPVFDVDDPDYGLRAGVPSALPFLNTSGTCAGYPTPTNPTYERCGIYVGPASTLPGVVPQSITINPATNSVRIVVGDVSTTAPQVLQFDLVVGVIALPFADDLFLANQSRVTSLNTPGLELRADSLDYIRVGAPDLTLRKGVLSTSNGSSTIEPVTSPVDGNLFDADAGDVVTYRLTITNIGTSRAYDVTITDPGVTGLVGCAIVPGSVRNGAGTALAFTGDILTGIRLTDPLPDGRTGNPNLARVTVDVRCTIAVTATPAQEELVNEASVVWSGLPGAPAYPPRADQAFIFFTDPILAKTGTPPLATIGQVVTYTLRATLPDGTLYNTRLVDTLPAGMALVACDSITVSGSVSTDLAGGFSAACAAPGNPTVAASGGQPGRLITWNLGEVVTGSSTGAGAATITIVYRAVILNLTAIDRGDRLINTARLEWDDVDGDGNDVVPDTHPTTTVIEPTLRVSKTAAPATGDAGDTITYTLVISHAPASDATAHDITLSDIIPAGATYVAGSVVHTDGVVPATLAESGGTVSATWGSLTTAQTSTFTYQVTLNSDVQPQQRIINTVNIAWTSLAGSPTNTVFNPNGVERTGNTANPGQRHDYRASSTATVTVNAPALAKSIIGTSEAFTTGNNVAVGELVRYRVSVTVPEGETRNAVLVDTLDAGLAFMNLTTAALASITFPAGVTAGAGIGTDILAAATVNADGSSATFTFGTLTNSNSSAAAEVIVIEYTVVVLDSSAIARGTQVNNSARLTYRNGFSGTTASLTASAANVTVVEPTLRVLKTASPATGDAGDTITFTLVVNHTLPPSNATAFDIVLTDVIPAGMVYVAGTLQHTAGIAPATLVQAAGTITATWDGLTTAQSSTLTFQVRLLETVQPGDTITNTASITYDSLPADNVVDQSPYNSASDERDYSASGSAPVSITGSSFDKDVTGTSVIYTGSDEFDPGIVDLNIDEEVTFTLITVIPEGTINGVQVIDTLPVGLRYVSSVVLPGSSLSIGGSLTPGVVGRTITWNLGTVTNLPDNLSTPGDVLTIRITAVAEDIPSNVAGVRLTNSATFRFTGGQPLTDTADVEIVEPRLQIDKSSPVTEGDAGDIIPYTVVVSHMPTSTSDAYDLVITDLMVPGLQLLPGTVTTSLGTIVTGNGAGDTTVRVNVPRLARGVSLTITYQARLANTVRPGQQLVNTATAGYDDKEGPGTRETTITDTHTVRVTAPQFSKAIVATSYSGTGSAAYDPANPDLAIGETVTYELVVTLPEGTAPITITDTLPAGLTLLSSRVTSLGGVTTTGATAGGSLSGSALAVGATGTVAGSQLTYAFGTLTNTPNGSTTEGDRVRIQIVARLVDDPANADGQVKTNNATLNYGTGSLSASASADVVEPLIELVKTFNPDSASVGSTVDLTLVLTNSSTQPAFEIRLTDPIHSSLRLDSVSVNVTGTAGTTFTGSSILGAGGQVIVSFNQLLPGESVTVTARVTILLNAVTQVIPNVATVTYDNLPVGSADNAFDRNASATGADDLTITRVIDLALVKTVSNTTPYIGDSVVYTLRATNNGPATATAVRVTDILPAGLTVTAFTPTTSCTYTAATRALNCAYASLAPTASVTITVTATVASTAIPGQQLTNSAATFASESGLNYSNETDATNNEDDVTITVGRLASVGDLLWYDANVNGVQDAGEAGVPGVTVYLLNSLGVIVRTDVTDSNGIYGFTGLRAGTYSVRLLSTSYPAGAVLYEDIYDGDRNGLSTFTLTESQALLDVDFAFIRRVSLGDRVWRDTNNNGVQDSGEPGIPGVTVILRGTDLFGNPVAASMPTGATGLYNFNVLPGTYTVSISTGTLPIALTPSYDLDGIATPHTTAVTVVNGVPRTDVDFGYAPTGSIGDRVWFDVNGNGLQETGETGLPGVTLTLTGTTLFGEVIAPRTAITGVNGIYSFSNVEAGTYTVTVTPPAGYTPTFDLNGGRDNRTLVGMGYGVVRTDVDFGYTQTGSIGDFVWLDLDGNGLFDGSDTPLEGIILTLTGTSGLGQAVSRSATTDINGLYLFDAVLPGSYTVTVTNPPASTTPSYNVDTVLNNTTPVTLSGGQNRTDVDFGYALLASIGDRVWRDQNGNGLQEADEPGISGVTVLLTGTTLTGTPVSRSVVTGTNGIYSFNSLQGGSYTMSISTGTLPAALQPTYDLDGIGTPHTASLVLPAGTRRTDVDFGYRTTGSIGDRVWLDSNFNGVQNTGETGISGVTVLLSGTNVFGQVISRTATTDANGIYTFAHLEAGTYTVTVVPPAGHVATFDVDGGRDNRATVTLANGQQRVDVDFGYAVEASIGDTVWLDTNANNLLDAGETGVPGISLTLTGTNVFGQVISRTTTTDVNGLYRFGGLLGGTYTVRITLAPTGTVFGYDLDGGRNGQTSVALAGGQNRTDVDFALVPLGIIGDRVWYDYNADGMQDAGEPGIEGVGVRLNGVTMWGQSVNRTTFTNGEGDYLFSDLIAGLYTVTLYTGVPANATVTYNLDFELDNITPDIGLAPGEIQLDVDFGYVIYGGIGDRVWLDVNGNALQDSGEPGIGGVTVRLVGTDIGGRQVNLFTFTDNSGIYFFQNLLAGSYRVLVSPTQSALTGLLQTYEADDTLNGDTAVSLGIGETVRWADFGYRSVLGPMGLSIDPMLAEMQSGLNRPTILPDLGGSPALPCLGGCVGWQVYHSNRTGNWQIYRLDRFDGLENDTNLSRSQGDDFAPSRSPDNRWMVFSSNRDGNRELYIASTSGDERLTQRVTFNTIAIDTDPAWGPDTRIVYESSRDGNWNLYLFDVATGTDVRLTADPGDDLNAYWSPDGATIIFQSNRSGAWQIYELRLATGIIRRLSDGQGSDLDPIYSASGDRIAFRSLRAGQPGAIYIMNAGGGGVTRISDPAGTALNQTWSPDSRLIVYQSNLDGDDDIYVYDTVTGLTRQLTDNDVPDFAPAWHCGSSEVLFTSEVTGNPDIFQASVQPLDAPPLDVLRDGLQLTGHPADDVYVQDSPAEENASQEGRLPHDDSAAAAEQFIFPPTNSTGPDATLPRNKPWQIITLDCDPVLYSGRRGGSQLTFQSVIGTIPLVLRGLPGSAP